MAQRALIIALLAATSAHPVNKCSGEFAGLLANDPHGDPQAFLQCQGSTGAWQRQLCPGELVFDFVNQQCSTQERKTRQQPSTLNIAILNNSCARGEQCIGGTICDPVQMKCLCPAGTTPVFETLSCEAKGGQNIFNPYNAKPEVPAAISSIFPNPTVQKFIESFFKPNQNFVAEKSGTDFKPNSNFVLNSLGTNAPRKMVSPGSTCRDGEICTGGSVCTQPFGMCLCQGNMEVNNRECTGPADCPRAAFCFDRLCRCMHGHRAHAGSCEPVAGIGGACASATQCAHHAACVEGRCACAEGALAHAGRCPAADTATVIAPGEECSEADRCADGGACEGGVCVCPADTLLADGRCVPV
ncbi:hypothetical protein PFISCL1PPCAC_25453, partial [Pristionchus fissidentatus]